MNKNLTDKTLGDSDLHHAAKENREDIVSALIANGANIEAEDHEGWTPLHYAARTDSLEVAGLLIQSGAKVDVSNDTGFTPLHWAARMESFEVAKLLIQSGANIEAEDHEGWTPLSHTGENYVGTSLPLVAQLLLQHGANTKGVLEMKVVIDQWVNDHKDAWK
jgi:ankyrin repeat protein